MSAITTRNGKGFPLTTAEMDDNLNNLNNDKQEISEKGEPNGYAGLDGNSKVPLAQMPVEFSNTVSKTSDTGSAKIPAGTVAQRGTSGIGRIRFNTDNGEFEGCKDGVTWEGLLPAGVGSGDVVGVVSSVANEILLFADTGGKQIKRGPVIGGAASSALSSVVPLINGTAAVGTSTALARQDHVHPIDTSREPAITGDVVTKFWSGTKTWRDLATDVRASLLTGINTTIATLVTSTDTVLSAIGKLQAQINKPTSTTLTYDGSGRLSTVTDTVGGVSKINTLSYNLDGSLNQTITVHGSVTRTETMNYTDNKLSSISVLEVYT